MKYCPKCGIELYDEAVVCPNCGCAQPNRQNNYSNYNNYPGYNNYDSGSVGWGVLGFFFPLIGLILFLVWLDTKPRSSRMAGKGALISTIMCIALPICLGILFGVLQIMANRV